MRWYDANARALPWRIGPSSRSDAERPDPYTVWLSEIMLQQTTVVTVGDYFQRFVTRWPNVTDLARADDAEVMAEWAGLGYYARARNLLKCARVIADNMGGIFPDDHDILLSLPGIGPYTAAAIAAIAFDQPATVVDGNVERVISRLFAIGEPLPGAKKLIHAHAARLTPPARPGDYAQAIMDLGATVCRPTSPNCPVCPWKARCKAHALDTAETYPRKLPKIAKPTRHGFVYVSRRSDGAWLLETRPPKGLLGGMLGWPGSAWDETPAEDPPLDADWVLLDTPVKHTFTHFHLHLLVRVLSLPVGANPKRGHFVSADEFTRGDLPTLMRKAYDVANAHPSISNMGTHE